MVARVAPPITWNPFDHAIDYAMVNGKKTPGICEVTGASIPRKWDEQRGYALSGAWLIYAGDGLAHFTLRIKLYTRAHWLAWWDFRPIIAKRPKPVVSGDRFFASVDALKIWHPYLDALGISAAVVEEEAQPVLSDESGEWTIEIKMIQWRQPHYQAAKPIAAKTAAMPTAVEKEMLDKSATRDRLQALADKP